jgi:predicted MFS family arabinose efflux permease
MDEEKKDRATFTLADIRALRLLAIALGVIFAGLVLAVPEPAEIFVAGGLVLALMLACPLAIYLRRRHQARKDEGQYTSPEE